MGKLYYFYGTMNSSKSANLLMKEHQFREAGCNTLCIKPSFDTRQEGKIYSRAIKEEVDCVKFSKNVNIDVLVQGIFNEKENLTKNGNYIFVDEVQFAQKFQIKQLWNLAHKYNYNVFCYGLKTNYKNELFDSVKELLVYADSIQEIKSMCQENDCNNKASSHIRIVNGLAVFLGSESIVGDIKGSERYLSVCQECYDKQFENYISNR